MYRVKNICRICFPALLIFLVGCQRHVLIDLLNKSGREVQVVSGSHKKEALESLPDGIRGKFLGPNPLVLVINGKRQNYFMNSIPDGFIRSEFSGRVVSLELDIVGKIYLCSGESKSRIIPQPKPFPLTSTEN